MSSERWSRRDLLVALNLYGKLRFGQLHGRNPVIVAVAGRLGRTPNALAMKLSNFASLDPLLAARGIRGLDNPSQRDRDLWEERATDPEGVLVASQAELEALFESDSPELVEIDAEIGVRPVTRPPRDEETDAVGMVRQRRGQRYFRDVVLNNYGGRCALTGLAQSDLLVASHIVPWAERKVSRLDVRNGIALNRLHDGAFDLGLIGFGPDLELRLSATLRAKVDDGEVVSHFLSREGQRLALPHEAFAPAPEYLAWHCERHALS